MKKQLPFVLLDKQPVSLVFYQPIFSNGTTGNILDFEISYCNKRAADLSGISPDELTGQHILSLVHANENVRSILLKQLTHVYTTGETIEDEYYNALIDKYFHVIRNKVEDGVLTMARDITTEIMLKKEKEKQTVLANMILNNALNGWFYCDAIRNKDREVVDFLFVRINPGFTRIIGLEEKEVVGKTHLSLFPTAKLNGIHEFNCKVVNERVILRKQMRYQGDHLDAWYDIVGSPLGEDGLLVTFADITNMKLKEIEAASLANALTSVINTVQVGIFTCKPEYNASGFITDFRFTMVNPSMSSYVAQEPGALVGSLASEWFPGYLQNGVFDMYRDTFIAGELQRKQFHYNVDGIDVYLDLQSTRIGDELLVTFSDYTPLQMAQLELQKSIRELQRSNLNLEEFTRAASHDLKEPIRKIQLFTDRLKHSLNDNTNGTVKELFAKMENAAARMRALVDDLLDYSQVSTQVLSTETVDLNNVVEQAIADLEVIIDESDAVIEYEQLPIITGHRRQLHQLFINLVHNSIKYRKANVNPHIFIHYERINRENITLDIGEQDNTNEFIVIEIADNGIGFEQSDSEKIFNVFTRLHSNKEYAGTGIGLSIASKVMENHNGYIFARGVKGQGATFTLLFPALNR